MNSTIKLNMRLLIDYDVSGPAGRILWIWGPVWKFNHEILVIGFQDSSIKRTASLCLTTMHTAHRVRCNVGMSPFHAPILMAEMVVHRSTHTSGLDIQPDLISVRLFCFMPYWVFDPDWGQVTFPLLYNIGLGWSTGQSDIFWDGAAIGSGAVSVMLSCVGLPRVFSWEAWGLEESSTGTGLLWVVCQQSVASWRPWKESIYCWGHCWRQNCFLDIFLIILSFINCNTWYAFLSNE